MGGVSRCWQHGIDNCPECEAAQLTQDRGGRHSQFQAFALFVVMAVAAMAFVGFVGFYALRTQPAAPQAVSNRVVSLWSTLERLFERRAVKQRVVARPDSRNRSTPRTRCDGKCRVPSS